MIEQAGGEVFNVGDLVANRYAIVRLLGAGGMGEVYEAQDGELGERVALKTVRPELAQVREAAERFKREVLLARRVVHPNVCRVLEFGYHKGTAKDQKAVVMYLTMEMLVGETLAQLVARKGRLDEEEALRLARQMSEALAAAHDLGIVHRDFKNSNVILVSRGSSGLQAVVTDFGLARAVGIGTPEAASLTATGQALGTPAFMAPEQVEGKDAGPAADIYALGVVLFSMLTGAFPFEGRTPLELAAKRLTEPPRSPRQLRPELSPAWESTILRCLARRPEERFVSVRDVLTPLLPRPASAHPRSSRRLVVAGAAAALAAVASLTLWLGPRMIRDRESQLAGTALAPAKTARRAIAVLGFRALGVKASEGASTVISELLGTELTQSGQLRLVPGETVTRVRAELDLSDVSSLSPETLQRLRRNLTADYVVAGTFVGLGSAAPGMVRLDMRLQDVANGEILTSVTVTGTLDDPAGLATEGGAKLRRFLGVEELDKAQALGVRAMVPSNPRAALLYGEGLDRLRVYDARTAIQLLGTALKLEPDHALTHAVLAQAWKSLGYDTRAGEEARRALALAGTLSQEEKLVIEAQAAASSGDSARAIEIYRGLLLFSADNIDYALTLASVLTAAGKPDEALKVLADLRKASGPVSDDPRIDLAEAAAAKALTDYTRQAELAGSAARKAAASGAQIIRARARLSECDARVQLNEAEQAFPLCEEARGEFESVGDRSSVADAENVIAGLLEKRKDFKGAQDRAVRALEAYRAIGHAHGIAKQLTNLARFAEVAEQYDVAARMHAEAVAEAERTGEPLLLASALNNRAYFEDITGNLDRAGADWARALALFREAGATHSVSLTACNVGDLHQKRGQVDEASRAYQEAYDVASTDEALVEDRAYALKGLGLVAAARGDTAEARKLLSQAEALFAELGDKDSADELAKALVGLK
jgi:tetratricopeptide (TPR) repeat protein